MALASNEINLYVVLATNPLLVRGANRSHLSFDNPVYRQRRISLGPIPSTSIGTLSINHLSIPKTGHRP